MLPKNHQKSYQQFQQFSISSIKNHKLLYKLVASFYKKCKICGNIVKEYSQTFIIYIRNHLHDKSLDIPTLIQAFLTMRNFLIDDEKIVLIILKIIARLKRLDHFQIVLFYLVLLIQNENVIQIMLQNYQKLNYHPNLRLCIILSYFQQFILNSFQQQEDHLINLLIILQTSKQQIQFIYLSKFIFQFEQMMYNIYPEIINKLLIQLKIIQKLHEKLFLIFKTGLLDIQINLCKKKYENIPSLLSLREDLFINYRILLLQIKFLQFQNHSFTMIILKGWAIYKNQLNWGSYIFIEFKWSNLTKIFQQIYAITVLQFINKDTCKYFETQEAIDFDFS
ncbi:unnamed protein product [Paramecium sonneborni]|uniref:Uncharacterized protein n=1 Tax=Paramecium sonneborni TaxID=65129 RepID=A0A8S1LB27_9CILI|nr:unnamed protein product [Paramecium sonneborni]